MKKQTCIIFAMVFTFLNMYAQQPDFSKLTGPYLGQKLPGITPELFAEGIVSKELNEHCPAAFSPDGKELFWSDTDGNFTIYGMKCENGIWSKPEKAPFTVGLQATNPVFTTDGKKLFFTSQIVEDRKWYITLWYVEKTNTGWSDRKKVESITNFGEIDYQVSFNKNGDIYFAARKEGGFGARDIYKSKLVNGEFSTPENLGNVINSQSNEGSVFIAPDESFILFRRNVRNGDKIASDFYLSRNINGKWTEPVQFSEKLNAKGECRWIGLSPDMKYVFFVKINQNSRTGTLSDDIFWVDSAILKD